MSEEKILYRQGEDALATREGAPLAIDFSKYRDAGNPHWVDVLPAGEFLGLADKTILHAGPPIEFARMCRGHRRSMVNACFFEGWAKTEGEALKLLESGEVVCEAAYDYATDGSGYGIITKSVPLLIVEDRDYGSRAGLFPSEGRFGGGFCGWGVYTPEIAENLRWMGTKLFPELVTVIKDAGGFPLRDLFAEARRMGDELHSCQKAIDCLFTRAIVPYALKCKNAKDLLDYFATADRFTHNFGQASSRALLLGLAESGVSGLVIGAGGNGVEYGIQVVPACQGGDALATGDGDVAHRQGGDALATDAGPCAVARASSPWRAAKWYTAPSPMIEGPYLVPGARRENQLPWIGDSSVTECRGWGGQIRAVNPAVACQGEDALATGERQGEDALATSEPRTVARASSPLPPVINGGMMDVNGGWMGAGSTRMPESCFAQAYADGAL